MIHAVIVDDEILVLNLLKRRLLEQGGIHVIGEFTDPDTALEKIPELKPDLIFLDVEMPEMDGIELGIKLLEYHSDMNIVFVTAYERYAIQAFKLNALHYILKPVDKESVDEIVKRMHKKNGHKEESQTCGGQIYLFGDICVLDRNHKRINWTTSKVEELFVLLLLNRDKGIHKWAIIEALWQEADLKKSQQNLYTTVFRLKKTFSDAGINAQIENHSGYYRILLQDVFCDLFEFEEFIQTMPEVDSKTLPVFDKVISQYQDDLLGSCAYPWSIAYREVCYDHYVRIIKAVTAFYVEQGDSAKLKRLYKKVRFQLEEEDLSDLKEIISKNIGNFV